MCCHQWAADLLCVAPSRTPYPLLQALVRSSTSGQTCQVVCSST
jgi:hypothetical protein